MKVKCHELTQAADPESTILEELIKEVDRLVSYLAVVNILSFQLTFSYSSPCCIFPLC
jgi:cytoskeleton-associated protein 5